VPPQLFIDHGKLKVRGRMKKKKCIPKNGRINIATIALQQTLQTGLLVHKIRDVIAASTSLFIVIHGYYYSRRYYNSNAVIS
jgi:hypothetical protein